MPGYVETARRGRSNQARNRYWFMADIRLQPEAWLCLQHWDGRRIVRLGQVRMSKNEFLGLDMTFKKRATPKMVAAFAATTRKYFLSRELRLRRLAHQTRALGVGPEQQQAEQSGHDHNDGVDGESGHVAVERRRRTLDHGTHHGWGQDAG